MLKVSFVFHCDVLCYKFPWAFGRLIAWQFRLPQSDGNFEILCTHLPKSISRGRLCLAHFHIDARASFFVEKYFISLISPILLPGKFFEVFTLPFDTRWSVKIFAKYAQKSSAVSYRPWWKEFSNLQDFCVICMFTVDKDLRLSSLSPCRQTVFLVLFFFLIDNCNKFHSILQRWCPC